MEYHLKRILSRLQAIENQVNLFRKGVDELYQRLEQQAQVLNKARSIAASEASAMATLCSKRGEGRYREIYRREFERIYAAELKRGSHQSPASRG
jgi:hypothetical protein